MMATRSTRAAGGSRLGALSTVGKVRFAVFTLAVLALAALNVMLTPFEVLAAAGLGWVQSYGDHQVHDMVISALLVLAVIVPAALMLYHPRDRVNTILAPVLGVFAVAVMATLANSFLATGFIVSAAIGVLALALHPAGRSLLTLDHVDRIDRRVAALFAVGAVPLVVYGALELGKQFGPVDDHVLFVHFGAMGVSALLVALMGALAVVRQRDWRFATWMSGLLAAYMGVASIGFPASESSLGVLGGALVILWAAAFVASVEYSRRQGAGAAREELTAGVEPTRA